MNFITQFKDALKDRALDQTVQAASPKRMLAYQIEREMAKQRISRVEMAKRLNTSRAALNRLLDPNNPSVTLQTIQAAASVLKLNVILRLEPQAYQEDHDDHQKN